MGGKGGDHETEAKRRARREGATATRGAPTVRWRLAWCGCIVEGSVVEKQEGIKRVSQKWLRDASDPGTLDHLVLGL